MTLSEMRQILAGSGIRLTKSLGQNFLHDGNQLRRIVEAAELTKADRVLEIGPGLGPLTELLIERAGGVVAIEKDLKLAEHLRKRFANKSVQNFQLLKADALEYLRDEARDWREWKLVSNLPYSVASPILVELAQTGHGLCGFRRETETGNGFIRSGGALSVSFARPLRCSSVTDFSEYVPSSRLASGQNPLESTRS